MWKTNNGATDLTHSCVMFSQSVEPLKLSDAFFNMYQALGGTLEEYDERFRVDNLPAIRAVHVLGLERCCDAGKLRIATVPLTVKDCVVIRGFLEGVEWVDIDRNLFVRRAVEDALETGDLTAERYGDLVYSLADVSVTYSDDDGVPLFFLMERKGHAERSRDAV